MPLVSIKCTVYNHEPFLRDCLNGFVMQKTNFKFEAVVHDDASTDGSAAIIKEFAEKYPDIIKPIFEQENQFSKGKGLLRQIMYNACRGTYIAECEGDDYWIDENKLQKQVDFMEAHKDVSLVFSRCHVLSNGSFIDDDYPLFRNINDCFFTPDQIYSKWTIPTASMLYRRTLFTLYADERIYCGDIVISLSLAGRGLVYGMSDYMTVYRLNDAGLTISRTNNPSLMWHRFIEHVSFLRETFPMVSTRLYDKKEIHYRVNYFRTENKKWKERDWENLLIAFRLSPRMFISFVLKEIYHYLFCVKKQWA